MPDHESYIAVINFGSEIETIILSEIINYVNDKLYVYVGSENSEYTEGYNKSSFKITFSSKFEQLYLNIMYFFIDF